MVEYRFQSQRRVGRRRQLALATIAVVAVLLADVASGGALRGVVRSTLGGIWAATAHVRESIANTGYFRTHRSLAAENAALREQVAQYQEDAAALDAVEADNEQLRAIVHLAREGSGVTAPVVSSFATSPYGTFLIGAGGKDGIRAGSIVLTPDGFVVGRVSEVHPHDALISGVLASGSSIDVVIGAIAATVEGRGGGNGRAEMPRDVPVATGTPAIAPTLGSRPIGILGRIESSQANAAETAYIQLPVNLSTLRYVYIISPRD